MFESFTEQVPAITTFQGLNNSLPTSLVPILGLCACVLPWYTCTGRAMFGSIHDLGMKSRSWQFQSGTHIYIVKGF